MADPGEVRARYRAKNGINVGEKRYEPGDKVDPSGIGPLALAALLLQGDLEAEPVTAAHIKEPA